MLRMTYWTECSWIKTRSWIVTLNPAVPLWNFNYIMWRWVSDPITGQGNQPLHQHLPVVSRGPAVSLKATPWAITRPPSNQTHHSITENHRNQNEPSYHKGLENREAKINRKKEVWARICMCMCMCLPQKKALTMIWKKGDEKSDWKKDAGGAVASILQNNHIPVGEPVLVEA